MAYVPSTPLIFARCALLSAALPLVAGCTVITPVDATVGGSAATESDTDPTDGTDGTDGTQGTDSDGGSTTGGQVDCSLFDAFADAEIAWGVPSEPCDQEACSTTRSAPCTVTAVDSAGPFVIDLACDDPDLGPSNDKLTLTMSQYGEIDLEVGAAVTLEAKNVSSFETLSARTVRLLDTEGLLILAAIYADRYGATVGDPEWDDAYLSDLPPLTGSIENYVCGGEPLRGVVHLNDGDAAISVPSGSDAVLIGERRWLISVEDATRWSEDVDDGRLDLAIVRGKL
ncbi:MAG: hypothetical protein KC486_19830 [Myxococcales bacterium]|nr:hypothetical protein [Myxococcales bacterium]